MTIDSRILPEQFTSAYEALWAMCYNSGGGMDGQNGGGDIGRADGRAVGQWRVKSGEVTSVGTVAPQSVKQVGKTARTMRDERAFKFKTKIDKRLRLMAREILASLDANGLLASVPRVRVCSGRCKKIGEAEWLYCPFCRGPMAEMDGTA
jgi:hypothetical protein